VEVVTESMVAWWIAPSRSPFRVTTILRSRQDHGSRRAPSSRYALSLGPFDVAQAGGLPSDHGGRTMRARRTLDERISSTLSTTLD